MVCIAGLTQKWRSKFRERLTTALLAVLVVSSLLLTYKLWYGPRHYEQVDEEVPEKVFFESPRALVDTIEPEWILINSNKYYLFRPGQRYFNTIWSDLSLAMQKLSVYEYRAGESLSEIRPTLAVKFDPLLPVGTGSAWLAKDRYREISGLEIWCDEEGAWAILQEPDGKEETALRLPRQLSLSALETIQHIDQETEIIPYILLNDDEALPLPHENLIIGEGLVVPVPPVEMSEFNLKKEGLDQDRLIDAFFANRSLVRKIQEKSGAIIYTDGTKGLRIKEGTGIEFSDPLQERGFTVLSYLSALGTVSKYICSYGGWPRELRLQKLVLDYTGKNRRPLYQATWQYYVQGYPLLGTNSAVHSLFTDSGLVEYGRYIRPIHSSKGRAYQIAPYYKALEAAIDIYYQQHGQVESLVLEALEIVYRETGPSYQPLAVPAWLVRLNGEEIMLHAVELFPWEETTK